MTRWAIGGATSTQTTPGIVRDAQALARARDARRQALLAQARREIPALRAQVQRSLAVLRRIAAS